MSRVLVISGMHRSGTSLVANYLERCGVDLGTDLLAADPGNRYGYYEDASINEFHRRLLWQNGIEDGFTVSAEDLPLRFSEADVERATEIVAPRMSVEQWGWKEPRTSLFLDLWERVVPEAFHLFLLREPLEVLDSLMRRGSNESVTQRPVVGLEMWRLYNEELLRFTKAHPDRTLWWETARFVDEPTRLVGALTDRFGLTLDPVGIDGVYDATTYHRGVRTRAKVIGTRNRGEMKRCLSLEAEIRSIAGGG